MAHPAPLFYRLKSRPALLLALIAVLLPFVPLLSHHLDGLALIAVPLSLIAAHMERGTARGPIRPQHPL